MATRAVISIVSGTNPAPLNSKLMLKVDASDAWNINYKYGKYSWGGNVSAMSQLVEVPTDKAGTFQVTATISNASGFVPPISTGFSYTVSVATPTAPTGPYPPTIVCPAGKNYNTDLRMCNQLSGDVGSAPVPGTESDPTYTCPQGGNYNSQSGMCDPTAPKTDPPKTDPPKTDPPNPDPNSGDIDDDGIPDTEDKDIDGDGINNEDDDDIDGDGIINDEDSTPSGNAVNNVANYETLYTRASQAQYLGDVFHADPSHTNPAPAKADGFSLPTPLLIMVGLAGAFLLYNNRKK